MTTFAPEAACEGSLRHGGKASRGKTYSKYITRHQARNLLEALSFADERGLRLNVAVDICWPMFSGFVDDRTRFARWQQRLSKWAKRRGFALTLIWTRELGKYGSPHTHVLIHVPPWLMESNEFQFALERALEPEGGPNHEKAIMIQPAYAPRGKLLYNLKGLHPREAKRFGVRPSYQGDLSGKRAGCTENIGSGARREKWEQRQRELERLRRGRMPPEQRRDAVHRIPAALVLRDLARCFESELPTRRHAAAIAPACGACLMVGVFRPQPPQKPPHFSVADL